MNEQIIESTGSICEEKEKVVDKAEEFIKQLELLGYDQQTFRFEGELTSTETLSYKKRLNELIDAVSSLSSKGERKWKN